MVHGGLVGECRSPLPRRCRFLFDFNDLARRFRTISSRCRNRASWHWTFLGFSDGRYMFANYHLLLSAMSASYTSVMSSARFIAAWREAIDRAAAGETSKVFILRDGGDLLRRHGRHLHDLTDDMNGMDHKWDAAPAAGWHNFGHSASGKTEEKASYRNAALLQRNTPESCGQTTNLMLPQSRRMGMRMRMRMISRSAAVRGRPAQ